MGDINTKNYDLVIRAGQGMLAFLTKAENGESDFHPYAVKSGMSLSANLRQAFKEQSYLKGGAEKAQLMVSSPVVLMPQEDYADTPQLDADAIYNSVMPGHKGEEKIVEEIPELGVVAIFAVNKDMQLVASDNCKQLSVQNIMLPVWRHLYHSYYQTGQQRKLFAYFHDRSMDVCSFDKNRIRFANVFNATNAHDALYYILYVWKQLGMNQKDDDLLLLGPMPDADWLVARLQGYVKQVSVIDQNDDLMRSPFAHIQSMPFDMKL